MTAPRIKEADLVAFFASLTPGSEHAIEDLHKLYLKIDPTVTDLALGRALGRYGCFRRVVHKSRGKRGLRKRKYTVIWELPGRAPGAPVEDAVTALVRDMGEGLHPLEAIYRRYLQMNFPGERLTRPLLMTELNRRGYAQMTDGKKWQHGGGRPCRFFPRLKDPEDLTVKCQDDNGAEMAPVQLGCPS